MHCARAYPPCKQVLSYLSAPFDAEKMNAVSETLGFSETKFNVNVRLCFQESAAIGNHRISFSFEKSTRLGIEYLGLSPDSSA